MFRAYRSGLSIYIASDHGLQLEVFYLAFPRFTGSNCGYDTITESCRQRVDEALSVAGAVAARFAADGRATATANEVQKAFNREVEYRAATNGDHSAAPV